MSPAPRRRTLLLASLIATGFSAGLFGGAAPTLAQDAPLNRLTGVEVRETDRATEIIVRGTRAPTFTVFKLSDPARLFVDITDADISALSAPVEVENGVVSTVTTHQHRDAVVQIGRVVVGLESDAPYTVRAVERDVVIRIDATQRTDRRPVVVGPSAPSGDAEAAVARADEATRAAQEAAREAEARADSEARAREEAATAAREAQARADSEAQARQAAEARAASAEDRALQAESERRRLEGELERLAAERRAADAEIDRLEANRLELAERLEVARRDQDQALARQIEAEEAARVASLSAERARVAQLESAQAASAMDQRAHALEAELRAARAADRSADAERLDAEVATLQAESARLKSAVEAKDAQLAEAERAATARRAEVARLERERRGGDGSTVAATPTPAPAPAKATRKPRPEAPKVTEAAPPPAAPSTAAPSPAAPRPVIAATPPPPPAIAQTRVTNVQFEDDRRGSRIKISFSGPAPTYDISQDGQRTRVLDLNDATIDAALERTLDTSDFGGPVALVSSFQAPPPGKRVRISVTLSGTAGDGLDVQAGQIVWTFAGTGGPALAAVPPPPPHLAGVGREVPVADARAAVYTGPQQSISVGGSGGPERTRRRAEAPKRRYSGRKINIDIKDGDIHNVLRLLAKEGNVNIVTSDQVSGTVTLHLKLVPWDLALETVLRTKSLDMVWEGDIVRVAPAELLAKERDALLKKEATLRDLKPLSVRLISVNHAGAAELLPRVRAILSPRGKAEVDERTNTMVISDLEEHIEAAEDMVRRLDTQTPQVLIEARIVEVNVVNELQFGIQWGGDATWSAATGNATGTRFPSSIGVAGGADDPLTPARGVNSTPNFAVNLPAAAGGGRGGILGMTFGNVDGTMNLNVRLSALEDRGTVKIVSSPKITTLDNREAIISQGVSIPISQVSAAGIQTIFIDAVLRLSVRPQVTQDGNIYLDLKAENNTPDFQNVGARGDPTILKKEAQTQLLLKDGDTTVIGGIYTSNVGQNRSGVPYLARIPILGVFFRTSREADRRSELLIFITPRIVNRAASTVRDFQ